MIRWIYNLRHRKYRKRLREAMKERSEPYIPLKRCPLDTLIKLNKKEKCIWNENMNCLLKEVPESCKREANRNEL